MIKSIATLLHGIIIAVLQKSHCLKEEKVEKYPFSDSISLIFNIVVNARIQLTFVSAKFHTGFWARYLCKPRRKRCLRGPQNLAREWANRNALGCVLGDPRIDSSWRVMHVMFKMCPPRLNRVLSSQDGKNVHFGYRTWNQRPEK